MKNLKYTKTNKILSNLLLVQEANNKKMISKDKMLVPQEVEGSKIKDENNNNDNQYILTKLNNSQRIKDYK